MSNKKRDKADDVENKEPPMNAKEELSDFFKTAFFAVLLAVVIRTFLFEPFNIPSGSMKPTLLVGDYLFVNKPAYGYSRHSFPFSFAPITGRIWADNPERGDVIVFKLPTNPSIDYIKRIVALPGERVQVREGRLYINDTLVARKLIGEKEVQNDDLNAFPLMHYIETLPGGVKHDIYEVDDYGLLDDTPVFTVPEDHYFVMGDNRDNSQDSRVTQMVGTVPFENIVGKADFIFFSTNGFARFYEIWKWPWSIRYDRLLDDLKTKASKKVS